MQIASILPLIGLALSIFAIGISVHYRIQNKKRMAQISEMLVSLNANSSILKEAIFDGEEDHSLFRAKMEVAHLEEMLKVTREHEAWWRKFNSEKISSLERTVDMYIRGIDYDEEERVAVNGGELGQLIEFKKKEDK